MTTKHDLIVIGAGLAGLAAAVRASELGKRVLVLERGTGDQYACNSRYSGGIIHISFHDVMRPASELIEQILKATDGEVSRPLAEALAADGRRLITWLQGHGIRFMRFNAHEGFKWCMAPPRPVSAGMDWKGRGPDVALKRLVAKLRELGGELRQGTSARALVMQGGVCSGVRVSSDGAEQELPAKAVIIADGGFQADPALYREHIAPGFESVLQRGAATAHGDGMRMAVEVGAAITRRRAFYGHLLSKDALSNDRVWPYPQIDSIAAVGIVVGADGKRFMDEGTDGVAMANRIAQLADPLSTTAIFDAAIWDGPGKTSRIPANPHLESAGGKVIRANSVDELAGKIGVPAAALAATVADYNKALAGGSLGALMPPRTSGTYEAMPVEKPPFMAIPLCSGITYTMDGIAIDADGRVQRADGTAISGLFAAGAATGGLEGGGKRGGYIGGLVKAGVFGLRSGEAASQS